jgi:hypothetical protein
MVDPAADMQAIQIFGRTLCLLEAEPFGTGNKVLNMGKTGGF